DTDGHILFFSTAFYTSTFSRKRLNTYSLFNSSLEFPILEMDASESMEVLHIFETVNRETKNPTLSTKELLRNHIDTLLIYFYRYKGSRISFTHEKKLVQDQFEELEILIEKHFKKHRKSNFYAEKMNMSMKQLSSLTKKTVAKTSSQLVLDRVILEAKRLLTHSD